MLTLAEQLTEEAYAQDIDVIVEPLPVRGTDALFVRFEHKALILLNSPRTQAQHACWLAEELGHYSTAPCHVLNYKSPDDFKAEARARRWVHDRALPPKRITEAIDLGVRTVYEAAEYLGVTEEFFIEAWNDYESRGIGLVK